MDKEILKVLENIEKLLKSGSGFSESKSLPASKLRQQQIESKRENANVAKSAKVFKALNEKVESTSSALTALNKDLVGLTTQVGKTAISFGSLNAQMSKFMASLIPLDLQQPAPEKSKDTPKSSRETDLLDKLLGQSRVANRLALRSYAQAAKIGNVTNSFLKSIAESTAIGKMPAPIVVPPPVLPVASMMPTPNQQGANIVGSRNPPPDKPPKVPFKQMLGQAATNLGTFIATSGVAAMAFNNLAKAAEKITSDFFLLSRVGLGSKENLYTLSKNAMLAGMSLKDYTTMIGKNITAASRAGSLDQFNKLISAADNQLAAMGIFGAEARSLQASLAQSSTMMGIKQDELGGAISHQIKMFDELRKSTNMTAEEFSHLMEAISNNSQTQKEMVGLAPAQRAARQQEMAQISFTGQRLGLTAEASKNLSDALIKQRGETVKNRFEQAGRIRQLGALTGNGADGERAAQIAMKGRRATAEETEELRSILGNIDAASQNAYENGSLGVQNTLDFFDENMGSLGDIMKANRPAELAKDSGDVKNKDFGKHVDKFGQAVGQFLALTKGFTESALGPLLVGLGAGLLTIFKGPISKVLTGIGGSLLGGGAKAVAAGVNAAPAVGELGNVSSALSKFTGALGSFRKSLNSLGEAKTWSNIGNSLSAGLQGIKTSMSGMVGWFSNIPKVLQSALSGMKLNVNAGGAINALKMAVQQGSTAVVSGVKTFGSLAGKATAGMLGGVAKFAGSFGPLAGVIDGVLEAFTGTIANALNPDAGIFDRIGGIVVSALTALPNMIISAVGFVFGDAFGTTLQNGFDQITVMAMAGFKTVLAGLFGGVASVFKFFTGGDTGLVKMLDSWTEGLEKSRDENFGAMEKLQKDQTSTLKTIGESNIKTVDEKNAATVKATAAADKSQKQFNNVQYGNNVTKSSVISDAKAIVADPQVQTQQQVAAAKVNTPDTTKPEEKQSKSTTSTETADLLTALNSILAALQENLQHNRRTADSAEQLVLNSKPTASFPSAEAMTTRFLKQGYA